jgi:hypothetical protein
MSKRKPSKDSDSPKPAAKAQRAAQAIVKSPTEPVAKHDDLEQAASSTEHAATALQAVSRSKHISPKQALLVEHPATALQAEAPPQHNNPEREAVVGGNPATALQDDCRLTMTNSDSKKALHFSFAAANVPALQSKLQEMGQANVQFAFEFAERLATMKSPVEFLVVIAEFTNKRIAMFQKYSKEMAEFSAMR